MLRVHLKAISDDTLRKLINEVFNYEQTGILADTSEIRNMAIWTGINDGLGYIVVCYNILYEYAARNINREC